MGLNATQLNLTRHTAGIDFGRNSAWTVHTDKKFQSLTPFTISHQKHSGWHWNNLAPTSSDRVMSSDLEEPENKPGIDIDTWCGLKSHSNNRSTIRRTCWIRLANSSPE